MYQVEIHKTDKNSNNRMAHTKKVSTRRQAYTRARKLLGGKGLEFRFSDNSSRTATYKLFKLLIKRDELSVISSKGDAGVVIKKIKK